MSHKLYENRGQVPVLQSPQNHDDQASVIAPISTVNVERIVFHPNHQGYHPCDEIRSHHHHASMLGDVEMNELDPFILTKVSQVLVGVEFSNICGRHVSWGKRNDRLKLQSSKKSIVFKRRKSSSVQILLHNLKPQRRNEWRSRHRSRTKLQFLDLITRPRQEPSTETNRFPTNPGPSPPHRNWAERQPKSPSQIQLLHL
mmetsp:Transcript_25085/g.98955  ORF Transcript_25085/g.98955 Transcript_25085/m.98955 type:complete len:200 (+) Transcript_25085:781-1380(+)